MVVPDDAPPALRRGTRAYEALWGLPAAGDILVWTHTAFAERLHLRASLPSTVEREGSHVDVPDLDLVLPHNAAGLDGDAHDIAAQASAAWEAAVCWDDDHAVNRLAQVRAV